jgi:hypothetical protein
MLPPVQPSQVPPTAPHLQLLTHCNSAYVPHASPTVPCIIPSVHYPTIDHQSHSQHLQILPLQYTPIDFCRYTPVCIHLHLISTYLSTSNIIQLLNVSSLSSQHAVYRQLVLPPQYRLPLPTSSIVHLTQLSPFVALFNAFPPICLPRHQLYYTDIHQLIQLSRTHLSTLHFHCIHHLSAISTF